MRRRGSTGAGLRAVGIALATAALFVLPVFAQQRIDCDSVEVTFERFYDVCGSNRQTLVEYKQRIERAASKGGIATIDELRLILCDVEAEDRAVQAIVSQGVAFTACDISIDENTLLALIESGVMPFVGQEGPRRLSDRGVVRLKRVVADRHARTE